MDFGWLDAFGGVKNFRSVLPSGYERRQRHFWKFMKTQVFVGI